jgi:hypothetical protein
MKGVLAISIFVALLFLCCFTTASCFQNEPNPLAQDGKEEASSPGAIDVYSQKGGKGPNTESAAVNVQEDVLLYAEVTYDGIPLEGRGVVFEVTGPNGPFNTVPGAYTNSSGIASAVLHMPWPTSNPESTLGTWSVKAETVYEDCHFEDVLTFSYGYILDILSVEAGTLVNGTYWVPRVYFTRTTIIDVRLTIKNINNTSQAAVLTFVCYDKNKVPIGATGLRIEIAAKTTQNFVIGHTQFPAWASLGDAAIYADCTTEWWGGWCYCPEKSTTVTIMQEDYDIEPPVLGNVIQEPETPLIDQEVNVSVSVTNRERYPFEVALFYREDNNTEWNSAKMTNTAGTYQATIPGFPADTRVSYVVVACDSAGNSAVDDNAGNYHVYEVIPEFSNQPFTLLLLLIIFSTLMCAINKRKQFTTTKQN